MILNQIAAHLDCNALGNHAVWAIVCRWVVDHGLDLQVIPQYHYPHYIEFWKEILGNRIIPEPPQEELQRLLSSPGVHTPTTRDKHRGRDAYSIIQAVFIESGFDQPDWSCEKISAPNLWPCNHDARAALIYPCEYSQRNIVYRADFWAGIIKRLHQEGYEIHAILAEERTARGGQAEQMFLNDLKSQLQKMGEGFDYTYKPSIANLKLATSRCSLSIGSSTGPSWALLVSDIKQIVLGQIPHAQELWQFGRNARFLEKSWIVQEFQHPDFTKVRLSERQIMSTSSNDTKKLSFHFEHGLGDTANFARLLKTYQSMGYEFEISCPENKRYLFASQGIPIVERAKSRHPWHHPHINTVGLPGKEGWKGNKSGCNIGRDGLPDIDPDQIWEALKKTKLDFPDHTLPDDVMAKLEHLRPFVLLHTIGNTCSAEKSIPNNLHHSIYETIVNEGYGVVCLDWDNRMVRCNNWKMSHLVDLFGQKATTEQLVDLIKESSWLIGVDSGPLHLAIAMHHPTIGLFRPRHYPSSMVIPSPNSISLVPRDKLTDKFNRYKRFEFQIIEHSHPILDVHILKEILADSLDMAHFNSVIKLCNGRVNQEFCDRERTFRRFLNRTDCNIIETGCLRCEEDWGGAGASSILFAYYVSLFGGQVTSIDIDEKNLRFAASWTDQFKGKINYIKDTGANALARLANSVSIDRLYLDSLDSHQPGHAEENLREFQAALPGLHQYSKVLIDDTPYSSKEGRFLGKGALSVPWALDNGWKIEAAGYQVLLRRKSS